MGQGGPNINIGPKGQPIKSQGFVNKAIKAGATADTWRGRRLLNKMARKDLKVVKKQFQVANAKEITRRAAIRNLSSNIAEGIAGLTGNKIADATYKATSARTVNALRQNILGGSKPEKTGDGKTEFGATGREED